MFFLQKVLKSNFTTFLYVLQTEYGCYNISTYFFLEFNLGQKKIIEQRHENDLTLIL